MAADTTTYAYDLDGNQTTQVGGGGRALQFDALNGHCNIGADSTPWSI
jgi:hypothetical protein